MSRDLSWSNHVEVIVNKANKVLGLVKRTVGSKNKEIFSMLYKSLVRTILEYACPVWSPHLVKDIPAIEKSTTKSNKNCKNPVRCHTKSDANYSNGTHFSIDESTCP